MKTFHKISRWNVSQSLKRFEAQLEVKTWIFVLALCSQPNAVLQIISSSN